ncbi:MAG: thiolase family protein [Planctomycetota bacterium]|nr:thiolase family protein [Planctomycetota bacterium]
MPNPRIAIVAAKRTAIGKFLGAFKDTTAADLGVGVVSEVLKQTGVAELADELIFGNARQAGSGPNIARQISVRAGLPESVPAYTINKACGSGLKTIVLGFQAITLGDAEVVVCGGTENMTRMPFMLDRARLGYRLGNDVLHDGMYKDGFQCPLANMLMGATAENLAEKYSIPREEQDKYAVMSQNRCEKAAKAGLWTQEIVPVGGTDEKGKPITLTVDEHPRAGATMEGMAKLPPVFKKTGTVHAGNSSGITDGAAALVLMSEKAAAKAGLKPIAFVEAYSSVGVDPRFMGIGPVPAIAKLEKKTGRKLDAYDVVELNEAFAAQVLACDRELHFNWDRTNVNGGSIALGHPIGCTGARFVVTLLHEMLRRDAKTGLVTLCMSGGLGMAVSFVR